MASVGMIYLPSFGPERLADTARRAEEAGVDELWVFEDCFTEGATTMMTAALAATTRLRVGVGIVPMPLRNVAGLAMEFATLERMFPGRPRFGVGHGVLDWMAQAGARVASPLTLMREYVPALRRLLAGDEVTTEGRYVHLDRVRLAFPPAGPVRVLAAGEGPKTLGVTGEVADGTILTTGTSVAMLRDARRLVAEGRAAAGRTDAGGIDADGPDTPAHEVVVFLMTDVGAGSAERLEAEFDAWGFTGDRRAGASGTVEEVAAAVRAFVDAGATTVLLQSPAGVEDLDAFADAVGRVAALVRG